MSQKRFLQIRQGRIDKAAELRSLGCDPYPSTSGRTHLASEVLGSFEKLEGTVVTVAGRLMTRRKQGRISFLRVQDQSETLQVVLQRDEVEAAAGDLPYEQLKLLDVGDLVEATGTVFQTERGEISVRATRYRVLAKSFRPLPDKWDGLKDRELQLRRRYIDLTMRPEARENFRKIGAMLREIRTYLDTHGFTEILTPVLQPLYGGGTAEPFRTRLNALSQDMFLSISHELYLKRCITAGYDKVFTIGRYFRNEGIDSTHNPEFSMVETMAAYQNYEDGMDLVEGLFQHVARAAFGKEVYRVGEHDVDMMKPWRRVAMVDLVKEETGKDFKACTDLAVAKQYLLDMGITEKTAPTIGECMYLAYDEVAVNALVEPTLVYGHPVEVSPLAKAMAEDPRYAERFEIIIGGMECGDNWSEENDPARLLAVWEAAQGTRNTDGDEAHPIDYDFIEMLEYGMPPTTGIGPGVERMAMIFCEQTTIDEVNFFPLMRIVLSDENRAIFGDVRAQPVSTGPTRLTLTAEQALALLTEGDLAEAALEATPELRYWETGAIGVTGQVVIEAGKSVITVPCYEGDRASAGNSQMHEARVKKAAGKLLASLGDRVKLGATVTL